MNRWKHRPSVRFWCGVVTLILGLGVPASPLRAQSFPQYDHVFLLIMENENYNQVIGNQNAPILNALAQDYGLATNYRGVADPSEPNYVAMLGGLDVSALCDYGLDRYSGFASPVQLPDELRHDFSPRCGEGSGSSFAHRQRLESSAKLHFRLIGQRSGGRLRGFPQ